MHTVWQNTWEFNGNRQTSDLGWEIRPHGGQFDLYRLSNNEWCGLFNSAIDAKDAADMQELTARRAEWATGDAAHVQIDGHGGIWDVDVALRLAEGHSAARVTLVRDIAADTPAGPTICVPVEIIRHGEYLYREYVLVGSAQAKEACDTQGYFEAVYLSFAEAEIARVPDITDSLEARIITRQLHKCHPYYDPKAKPCNPWKRSVGDFLDYVRKNTNI